MKTQQPWNALQKSQDPVEKRGQYVGSRVPEPRCWCHGLCDEVLKTSMRTVRFDALEHLVGINTDSQLDNSYDHWGEPLHMLMGFSKLETPKCGQHCPTG